MILKALFCLSIILATTISGSSKSAKSALDVIDRYTGDNKTPVKISISLDKDDGRDVFETTVRNGKIFIDASSPVAACRAFYDYVKSEKAGIVSWTGNRLELSEKLPNKECHRVVSPYKHHYYFNVVTYGYTMPYWNWDRWEKEIDWMALHGIDMPLALVANEAITARVWKKLGLTDDEISEYFVAPAHLPWMRMGNISGIDGPLPSQWHEDQIELQHKILKRMKGLGMKPICPGFAGFVPKSLLRLYPDITLLETSWCDGAFHNWMISPEEPLFTQLGQMFIEEWESEFGKNDYYIVDSFNEMDIPFPPKGTEERYALLADYGEKVYSSIKKGNPDAVWVMQGWMFGYQRHIWDYKTLEALVSRIPDDKMLILDLAVDYNRCFWNTQVNWEFYKGLFGKQWVYSVIPNMGGKTGLTGKLEVYANGHLDALNSSSRGNLVGYGMAPEGLENNEVIYELICDAGWSNKEIELTQWLHDYSICRYGKTNDDIMEFWTGMKESVYGSFTDHPRFNWQFRPGVSYKGSINANESFYSGIESFVNAQADMRDSELYRIDMIEMTVQYLGGKLEILTRLISNAFQSGNTELACGYITEFETLMLSADRLLASHPTLRLENWIKLAREHGDNTMMSDYYEKNARRIVTIWGPPVDDYSARIWSGLLRDYYLPRWQNYFNSIQSGVDFNFSNWERDWVENKKGLSQVEPFTDIYRACEELIERASKIQELQL